MWKHASLKMFMMLAAIHPSTNYVRRCGRPPELTMQWSRELSHSHIITTPLLTDVNADSQLDVVVTTFDGEIHVVDGSSGTPLSGTHWPVRIPHSSFHASALQQIDGNDDGMLDILVMTSQGQLLLLDHFGDLIPGKQYQIGSIPVLKEWYTKAQDIKDFNINHIIITDNLTLAATSSQDYVMVDPHVLATPVLADVNRDNQIDELIIPVSYYFDEQFYINHPDSFDNIDLNYPDLKDYLAGCLMLLNVTTMELIKIIPLELTKADSSSPGYVLFTPTVVDLDSKHSSMEIVVGTSTGRLHVVSWSGVPRPGFPVTMTGSIHGQVVVDDINGDGQIELVAMDTDGNVNCYDSSGVLLWQQKLSTEAGSTGIRVADLDGDGQLEIVIVTADGHVFALSAVNGEVQEGWPVRISRSQQAPPLITWLTGREAITVAILDDQGHLHLLTDGSNCKHTVDIRETSYVSLVAHHLIDDLPGLQYIVTTQDGSLLCLGQGTQKSREIDSTADSFALLAWPAETSSYNNFAYMPHERGVAIHGLSELAMELSTSSFSLRFSVMNVEIMPPIPYSVKVYLGSELLAEADYESGGTYSLALRGPDHPTTGHLTLLCYNKHGHLTSHTIPVELHQSAVTSVRWVLVGPVVGMGILLLLLHGYPEADLLPMLNRGR